MKEYLVDLNLPILTKIARKYNKIITFLDLETTTFIGSPGFGITEIGMLHLYPDGTLTEQTSLINPEFEIPLDVQEITHITNEMVADMPTWGVSACELTKQIAYNNIVIGFNSIGFDFPAIINQNERYQEFDTVFTKPKDVRSYWRLISGKASGRLVDIAATYGIVNAGAHRAMIDVIMTALVLEKFLEIKGIDFFDHPGGALNPRRKLEMEFVNVEKSEQHPTGHLNRRDLIVQHINNGLTDYKFLMKETGFSEYDLNFLIGDLLIDGEIDIHAYRNNEAQMWLKERVPYIIHHTWEIQENRGKLKPLMLAMDPVPKFVDYIQLRIFIIQYGFMSALEKNNSSFIIEKPNTENLNGIS